MGDNSATALAGTPLYLAPELLSGMDPTVQSDIYSLGVLLYHLLTRSYHLLEAGADLRTIQVLTHTTVYLHLSQRHSRPPRQRLP